MKKVKFVFLFLYIFLFSCKGINTPNRTTVKFWYALNGMLEKRLLEAIIYFNAVNPDVRIEAVNQKSYDSLNQMLLSSIVANEQPDIAQVYSAWAANFVDEDLLVPLDTYITNKEIGFKKGQGLNDIYKILIKNGQFMYKGKKRLFTLPFNKSLTILYYNKDLIKKASLQSPPKYWYQVIEAGKNFKKIGKYAFAYQLSTTFFILLLNQKGGNIFNNTVSQSSFYNTGLDTIHFMLALYNKYKISPYPSRGYDYQKSFINGKSAMMMGSSVSTAYIKNRIPFEWDVAPIPCFSNFKTIIGGPDIAIFKKDKKKSRAAWKFIKWFISSKQTAEWFADTYYLPVRKSALKEKPIMDIIKKQPGWKEVLSKIDYAISEPNNDIWMTGRAYVSYTLQNVLAKTGDTKILLKDAENKINTLIKKKNKLNSK